MKEMKRKWPKVGMRIMKSAIGVLLVFVIYLLRGKRGAPFYTALSVLWCMQPQLNEAKSKAFQRTVGTMIGAFYGLIVILIEFYVFKSHQELLSYIIIAAFIIPVIYTTLVFNKKDASYFSCVVFLSIVMIHLADDNPYLFVLNRVVDTMIGIGLAYAVNTVHLPRKRRNHILFVSELDDVLLNIQETMTPYSKYELNRMLGKGLNFTIATMRPPAALIPALQGIKISLPVIAMDGAVLYDLKENRVLKKYEMPFSEVKEYLSFFNERNFQCFVNVIIEDSVVIYYDAFRNPVEQKIYENLRKSPYRNYMKGPCLEKGEPVYLMLIDTKERIEGLYKELEEAGYTHRHKILKYASTDYPGYMYIKIYNKEANKKNMIRQLQAMTGLQEVVSLGQAENMSEHVIYGEDCNKLVRNFRKAYEPYFWEEGSKRIKKVKMSDMKFNG